MNKIYKNKRLDEGVVRTLFGSQLPENITEAIYDAFIDMHKSDYNHRSDERRLDYIVAKFNAIIRVKESESTQVAKEIKRSLKKIKFTSPEIIDKAFLYMLKEYDKIINKKYERLRYGDSETYTARTGAFRRSGEERVEPSVVENFQYFYKKITNLQEKKLIKEAAGPISLDAEDLEKIFNSYLEAANTRYFANKTVIPPETFTTVTFDSSRAATATPSPTTAPGRSTISPPPSSDRPEDVEPRGVAARAGSAAPAAPAAPTAPTPAAPTAPTPAAPTAPTPAAPTATSPAAAASSRRPPDFNELILQLKNAMGDGRKAQIVAQAFKQYFEDLKNKTVVRESSNRKFKIVLKEGAGTGAATTIVNSFLNTDKPDYEQIRKPEIAAILINFISKHYMKDLQGIVQKNNLGSLPTFKGQQTNLANQKLDRATAPATTVTSISPGSEISVSGIKYKVDADSGIAKLIKIGE